jgi:hypothetical protein
MADFHWKMDELKPAAVSADIQQHDIPSRDYHKILHTDSSYNCFRFYWL